MLIAIYHLSIKIISRGNGKSSVAAAAYRAGEKIKNDYDGKIHDYTRKSGVVHTEILLPDNAPTEYSERAVLWNAVEKVERYKTAQLAREIEVALPRELTAEQNISLVREYAKSNFVDEGMCADFAIHDKKDGNPHAHIMLTMRPLEIDGKWGQKSYSVDGKKVPTVDWNEHTKAEEWRESWAVSVNKYLEISNIDERIDHRSYERQGIDQIPTIHLGAAASAMEKRGIHTERGNINREIEITNQRLRQLKARVRKLQDWIKEEQKNEKPPTLADVITNILSQDKHAISNLKAAAKMLSFLQENNIQDVADLSNKIQEMVGQQSAIKQEFNPIERRLKTLDEHLKHSGNFKNYRKYKGQYEKLYAEYKTLEKANTFGTKRKIQKALDTASEYYREHRNEITSYETAEEYLCEVLQGRFDVKKLPPITKWTAECEKLTTEKGELNQKFLALRSDISEVEKYRKIISDIMGGGQLNLQELERQNEKPKPTKPQEKQSIFERLAEAKIKADEYNASRAATPRNKNYDRDGR